MSQLNDGKPDSKTDVKQNSKPNGKPNRKDEHLRLALEQNRRLPESDFDKMRLIHHSLRSIDVAEVDLGTTIGPIYLDTPFFVNAMTGGSAEGASLDANTQNPNIQNANAQNSNTQNSSTQNSSTQNSNAQNTNIQNINAQKLSTREVNRQLAEVCRKTGLAMATGSVAAAVGDGRLWPTYEVIREVNPEGILFVNVNPDVPPEEALAAAKRLGAQGIQVHLNSVQELLMPEGDRAFSGWGEKVAALAKLPLQVTVKETGSGMTRETVEALMALGVRVIDVSGRGGTNFAVIENERSEAPFEELMPWGQSTVESLLEAGRFADQADLIASGGIRSSLDMVKSFVLGAKACGLSGQVLRLLVDQGVEATVATIEQWKVELRKLMALLGARNVLELRKCDYVLAPDLWNYKQQRNL